MRKKTAWWSIFALVLALLLTQLSTTNVSAEIGACGAPELICKAARNQDISLTFRDRCTYEQRAHVELFEKKKDETTGKLETLRETTVKIEPSSTPDETGKLLVVSRVIADTDDKGKPKSKVDPNARTGLVSGAFLDLLFFPLLPEKLSSLEFEELKNTDEKYKGEKLYRFGPKPGVTNITVASGKVYVNAQTGAVLTIQIEGLHNLKVFDKILEKLGRVAATIDYSEFDSKYRMPALARGGGISDIRGFKGIFKFTFEEGKYVQVLKLQ